MDWIIARCHFYFGTIYYEVVYVVISDDICYHFGFLLSWRCMNWPGSIPTIVRACFIDLLRFTCLENHFRSITRVLLDTCPFLVSL